MLEVTVFKNILCGKLLATSVLEAKAQLPLPCTRCDNSNLTQLQQFNGAKSAGCFEMDYANNPVSLNDNHLRDYTVTEGVIQPGFSYVPADSGGQFQITLGPRTDMEGAWFEPINYFPQLYEKIEWGVKLPDAVEQAIDNWIHNDQFPLDPPMTPALNPFDPEQIDLKAIVNYLGIDQPVFGFFYREYERMTKFSHPEIDSLQDVNKWNWLEHSTNYRFRFRWSSTQVAHHSVRIVLNVPSMGTWEMQPFEFDSYWGDPRQSFISVTNNKHYFKTDDWKRK